MCSEWREPAYKLSWSSPRNYLIFQNFIHLQVKGKSSSSLRRAVSISAAWSLMRVLLAFTDRRLICVLYCSYFRALFGKYWVGLELSLISHIQRAQVSYWLENRSDTLSQGKETAHLESPSHWRRSCKRCHLRAVRGSRGNGDWKKNITQRDYKTRNNKKCTEQR